MIPTVERRRIEVLVDAPLAPRIIEHGRAAGVKGYTLLPTLSGQGAHGAWSEDLISGAQQKVIYVAIVSEERAAHLIERLAPILESHGLVVMNSAVSVIRAEKY